MNGAPCIPPLFSGPLPPRWIGAAMIATGAIGLLILVIL